MKHDAVLVTGVGRRLGLHMASILGALPITPLGVLAGWLVGGYWFTVVLVLYLNEGKPFALRLAQFDLYFRIAVVVVLLGWCRLLKLLVRHLNRRRIWMISPVLRKLAPITTVP